MPRNRLRELVLVLGIVGVAWYYRRRERTIRERAQAPVDHRWLADPEPDAPDLDVVLWVGRLAPEKDLDTLVRAFDGLHDERPETRLLVAGTGPERERVAALVERLGLSSVVDFQGYVDPAPYMARASVFALSSTYEGLPTVLVEALAVGCPVVSTDCPSGPREILADGDYGRLVPVGDDDRLAAALAETLDEARDGALSVYGLFLSLAASFGPVWYALGRPDFAAKIGALRVVVMAVLIYPATLRYGYVGTAGVVVTGYLVAALPADLYLARGLVELRFRRFLAELAYPVVAAGAMGAVVWAARESLALESALLELVALVALGVVVYGLIVLVRGLGWQLERNVRNVASALGG